MARKKAHALLMISLAALVWSATTAWAHKVTVFAYVQGDAIIAEGFFGGKAKAIDCVVEVFDRNGAKLKEGKTDANGIVSFPIADLSAATGDLRFVLTAGMGHRADYTLSAADLPSGQGIAKASDAGVSVAKSAAEKNSVVQEIQPQDTAAIKKMVEDAVKAQLEPVLTMLGSQQKLLLEQKDKSPSMTEIIGGIGWIFGIAGVWAYFAGRKQMTKQ